VLGVLFVAYVSNSVDRGILSILLEPIKLEFTLSDTELGLLGGLAFAIFYSTLGLPIAALADRTSRRNVLAFSIALWSVATALCGAAANFWQLVAARVGTAIGEAGGTPPSAALIADYFPAERRATALSIYALAIPIGGMLGSFGGGWGNELLGWRLTFVCAGLPGLIIAALVFLTVREPRRGLSDNVPAALADEKAPRVGETLRLLWSKSSFRHLSFGAALHSLVLYGTATFNTSFFVRSHDMTTGEAGNWLALFLGLGAIGTFLGGYLSDRMSRATGDRRWYLWIPAIGCIAMVPFQFTGYLTDSLIVIAPSFVLMTVLASFYFGPSAAMTQALVTLRMRAVAASFLLFIQTIISLSLGPVIVGMLSDALAPRYGAEALRYSLVIVGLVNIWAGLHYFLGARSLRADLDATETPNRRTS
jgi:MFS family permease